MNQKIIDKIRTGEFSSKELENLYSNAKRLGRDEILKEAKGALKERDLRSYVKKFIKPIRGKVKRIAEELANENDWALWENNKVGNGAARNPLCPTTPGWRVRDQGSEVRE